VSADPEIGIMALFAGHTPSLGSHFHRQIHRLQQPRAWIHKSTMIGIVELLQPGLSWRGTCIRGWVACKLAWLNSVLT